MRLLGGLRETPGSPAQIHYVVSHFRPTLPHAELGTKIGLVPPRSNVPRGFVLRRLARFRVDGADGTVTRLAGESLKVARRPICDSPWRVPTDVDSTFCADHRGEASRSSRAPSADVEFDPV